ncbi:MAG TPA: SDR family NAD(P)-dependent oxidoreductase [Rhodospirillales bacterium]|nr:SDR family NAD(P)-dependent oxidoreductase [Rhodospirillales bacterium]
MNSLQTYLKEKSVLITGASQGVGLAITETLSSFGMKIGLLARSEEKLIKISARANSAGSEAFIIKADLSDRKDVEDAARKFEEVQGGPPDFLINNAGIGLRGFWKDIDLDAELKVLSVNYTAPIILTRYFLPAMLQRNRGHIININAFGGMFANPYQGAYGASKAALIFYASSLAYELEHTNVQISSIIPGAINTDFLNQENYEVFKNRSDIVSPKVVAKKVLEVIKKPREMVFVGPTWKKIAIKVINLYPEFFRKIVEKGNIPPSPTVK